MAPRASRAVAVTLGLGNSATIARSICPDLPQGNRDRPTPSFGTIILNALKLEPLTVATPVGSAIAFDLLRANEDSMLVTELGV